MKNNNTIYQVDAFTSKAFKGNPAGVMILESALSEELMQNIAFEMNLSETAFVLQKDDHYQIRYFTPTIEIPLCGHATLASAHIMFSKGLATDVIKFKAKGGDLTITQVDDGIKMVFPKYTIEKATTSYRFQELIGFNPGEVYTSEYGWVIAMANSEEEILNSKPNFTDLINNGLGHLMITSKSSHDNIDFVVRCFAPDSGIDEDPVTGSAQCALVPFWNLITGKTDFNAMQVSERTGLLKVSLADDQVEIVGQAITIFEAELKT